MTWLADDLCDDVRRSGFLPDAHDLTDADLLKLGNEELAEFAKAIRSAREEYRGKTSDVAIVNGTTRYRTPRRAMAGTVRRVAYIDASGNECPAEEVADANAWMFQRTTGAATAMVYRWEEDELVLLQPMTSGSIRFRYTERFPRMVAEADCARLTNGATSTTVTSTGTPGAGTTTAGGKSLVDIIRGDSPFPTLYTDLLVGTYAANVHTFEVGTIDPTLVGEIQTPGKRSDYLAPRDCTPYVPLAIEMHPALSEAVTARAMLALRDPSGAQRLIVAREKLVSGIATINPRNADRKPAIIPHGGRLRGKSRFAWRG